MIAINSSLATAFARQQAHAPAVAQTGKSVRIAKLKRLHDEIIRRRADIAKAVHADFKKSPYESDITEVSIVTAAIRHTIAHLGSWMTPKSVPTPLPLFGSSASIYYEPKGVCLIISPWNFPFNLSLDPLVSAVAAGNCAIIKPSEYTPHSSALLTEIVRTCFSPEEVMVVEGDADTARALLELPFNHIFFTGSPAIGKVVMAAAAQHLASVTLELGGKSPVIVDESADLELAATKIMFLKCMNAGQICIAPDYVWVHENCKQKLVQWMQQKTETFFGKTLEIRQKNPDYCRLVNSRHFERVKNMLEDAVLKGATLAFGGVHQASDCFMEPTVLENIPPDSTLYKEEIFGPLLPIYTFKNVEEAIQDINSRPRPLSMYIFSRKNGVIDKILAETRAGGVTINDCGTHFYNHNLPFGGVNNSGIGKAKGEHGFLAFSNEKAVLRQTRFLPTTNFFLPPYGNKIMRFLLDGVVKWM